VNQGEDQETLLQALSLYESKNVDFTNALVTAPMQKRGTTQIFSFDELIQRVFPEEEIGCG